MSRPLITGASKAGGDLIEHLRKAIPDLPQHITTLNLRLSYKDLMEVTVSFYPEEPGPSWMDGPVTQTFELVPKEVIA